MDNKSKLGEFTDKDGKPILLSSSLQVLMVRSEGGYNTSLKADSPVLTHIFFAPEANLPGVYVRESVSIVKAVFGAA